MPALPEPACPAHFRSVPSSTAARVAAGLGALALLVAACSANNGGPSPTPGLGPTPTPAVAAAFPVADFALLPAIWPHDGPPAVSEFALFRQVLSLDSTLDAADLLIFADTRYQLWMDGRPAGRGPARFARDWREYDVIPLGDLAPGPHVIAVLVQWAPNTRRSESSRPLLKAVVTGQHNSRTIAQASSAGAWRSVLSDAWRRDAALVHAWGLIGPTELLDLRRLNEDWTTLGFDDAAWPAAVAVTDTAPASVAWGPRSIPRLAENPVSVRVLDSGVLSPGRNIAELSPSTAPTVTLPVSVRSGALTVETLVSALPAFTPTVTIDDAPVLMASAAPSRPDVVAGAVSLTPGVHRVSIGPVLTNGLTLALGGDISATLPFTQGTHAGRRLLLAEPVSQADAVRIDRTGGLTLTFQNLPAYLVLDLDRTTLGRLKATVSGPNGSVVDVGWDEKFYPGTQRPLPFPGRLHPEWNQVDSWIVGETPRTLTTVDLRAGRYVLIAVWGSGPVVLRDVQVLEEGYPVVPRGAFSSSDPLLNRIWQVGADTARVNMSDAYADPWRERGQWWGDAFVIDQINRAAFGDSALLARGLRLMQDAFADSPAPGMAPNNDGMVMLDYAMLWAQSLADYTQRTGDVRLARSAFPALQAFIGQLAARQNAASGLLDVPQGHWSTTDYLDPRAGGNRYGQSTALNALYYTTLLRSVEVALALGEGAQAASWDSAAGSLRQSINERLLLPNRREYAATIYRGQLVTPSAYAQAWTLAAGVVPDDAVPAVADSLLRLLPADPENPVVDTYGMFWVLEALSRAGRWEEAATIIRVFYGRMLNLGAVTWWEGFASDRSYSQSYAHGWSGAPTWFLTARVLGASQTGPSTWEVKPSLTGVMSATGTLPMPVGELAVAWSVQDCAATVKISAPTPTSGVLVLPARSANLRLNGQPVTGEVTPSGIRVNLPAGVHRLEMDLACTPG